MWRSKFQLPLGESTKRFPTASEFFFTCKSRKTSKKGEQGVFTSEFIPKGSVVIKDGGVLLTSTKDIPQEYRGFQVIVEDRTLLAPKNHDKKDLSWFLNHSCSSNLARIGCLIYVAKKDIHPNEELTVDYAPLVAGLDFWFLICHCGSKVCRKKITGNDWKKPTLQKKFWTEWPPYIQRRIIRERQHG